MSSHEIRARTSGQIKADPKTDIYGKIKRNVDARHLLSGLGEASIEVGVDGSRVLPLLEQPSLIYKWVDGKPKVAEAAKPDAERKWQDIDLSELSSTKEASPEQLALTSQHLPMVRDAIMRMKDPANPQPIPEQELMASVWGMLQRVDRGRDSAVNESLMLLESGAFAQGLGSNPEKAMEQLALTATGAIKAERAAQEMAAGAQKEAAKPEEPAADFMADPERGAVDLSAISEAVSGLGKRVAEKARSLGTSIRRSSAGQAVSQVRDVLDSYGESGKRMSTDMEDVVRATDLRSSPAIAKAEATWKGLSKPEREIVGKMLDGLTPEGGTPELAKKADELRQIMDAPQLEAMQTGLRRHDLTGRAMPTRVKPEHQAELAEMLRKNREDRGDVVEEAESDGRLSRMARRAKRKKEGYIEGARTLDIPEHMREWDVAEVVPDALYDSYRTLEGTKKWGQRLQWLGRAPRRDGCRWSIQGVP